MFIFGIGLSLSIFLMLACALANVIQLRPSCTGGSRWQTLRPPFSETDIFASSSCNLDINTLVHIKKWKDNALVGNNVHFVNEFDLADYGCLDGMESRSTSYRRLDEELVKLQLHSVQRSMSALSLEQNMQVPMSRPFQMCFHVGHGVTVPASGRRFQSTLRTSSSLRSRKAR